MTTFEIDPPTVFKFSGADARKFLQGFTTQQLMDEKNDSPLETFITNLKGRCVAHGIVFDRKQFDATDESLYFLTLVPAESDLYATIFPQLDRYIIREDVTIENVSSHWNWYIDDSDETPPSSASAIVAWPILSSTTKLIATQTSIPDLALDSSEFNAARIAKGFPLHGVDFTDANLPQEIDRTEQSISFTKGCYLGQETIARLDALGQTQKELALLKCINDIPPDVEFTESDLHLEPKPFEGAKPIGKITSWNSKSKHAIAMIRRPHFAPGNQLYATFANSSTIEFQTIAK